jgi:hypothetical protein
LGFCVYLVANTTADREDNAIAQSNANVLQMTFFGFGDYVRNDGKRTLE